MSPQSVRRKRHQRRKRRVELPLVFHRQSINNRDAARIISRSEIHRACANIDAVKRHRAILRKYGIAGINAAALSSTVATGQRDAERSATDREIQNLLRRTRDNVALSLAVEFRRTPLRERI